jgi:uncharacterized membrane protein
VLLGLEFKVLAGWYVYSLCLGILISMHTLFSDFDFIFPVFLADGIFWGCLMMSFFSTSGWD